MKAPVTMGKYRDCIAYFGNKDADHRCQLEYIFAVDEERANELANLLLGVALVEKFMGGKATPPSIPK